MWTTNNVSVTARFFKIETRSQQHSRGNTNCTTVQNDNDSIAFIKPFIMIFIPWNIPKRRSIVVIHLHFHTPALFPPIPFPIPLSSFSCELSRMLCVSWLGHNQNVKIQQTSPKFSPVKYVLKSRVYDHDFEVVAAAN
jgi:hypothetical protein